LEYTIAKGLRKRGGTEMIGDTGGGKGNGKDGEPEMIYFTRTPRLEFLKALSSSRRFGDPKIRKLISEIAISDSSSRMSTHFWF